tara:strand:- start:2251 stop:3927 length:1677 start_codon:yes stop_codon:yes gene_type:complete
MTYTRWSDTHNTWKREECHSGNVLAFTTHDGIEVWAGGSSRDGGWWLMDPLPDLAMGPDNEVKKGYSKLAIKSVAKNMEGWKCTEHFREKTPPAVLELDFPDFGIPWDCDIAFWEALALDIREQEVKRIHAMCMGGHGRTGIQLACLKWHLGSEEERKGWADANALISEVRTHYCNKAVEGEKQQKYVAWICGIPMGDTLGFHKGNWSTTTTTTMTKSTTTSIGSKELTAHNRALLECKICDCTCWEDDKVLDIMEGDDCFHPDCNKGEMIDVTDFLVKTTDGSNTANYAICLTTLDVCSVPSAMTVGPLNVEAMEKYVGKNWRKVLDKAMSNNSKITTRGKMLRNLNDTLKVIEKGGYYSAPELESEGVLVVYTTSSCDPEIVGAEIPNWSNKKERGGKTWIKCGFCSKNLSPDRLAYAVKWKKEGEEMHAICPECMTNSGLQFSSRMESIGGMHVCIDDELTYRLVDGVSPQGLLVTASIAGKEEEKAIIKGKTDNIVDDKQIADGLKELGLTAEEIEGYYDAVGDEYDDWDDIDEEVIDLRKYDDYSSDGGNKDE